MGKLKLKVCGMKDADNIHQLTLLRPDFIGFIFYKNSPRYVGDMDEDFISRIPISIKKVGVFVNESFENISKYYKAYGLDYVQLHGDEDLEFTRKIKNAGMGVIKVFRLLSSLPYSLANFSEVTDYFLFDTASSYYGGSGRHFDWSILQTYNLKTPFLLSGGIGADDVDQIKKMRLEQLIGIDVNSRFEFEPGVKNIGLIKKLSAEL